jgi:hypothetical protein
MSRRGPIAMLLLAALCAAPARAETRVSGSIDKNVRWTPENGPYILTGDLLVTRKGYLIIAPGTQIIAGKPSSVDAGIDQIDHIDSQLVAVHVHGMLACQGTREKRISFTPLIKGAERCHWYGIVFDGSYDQLTEVAFTDIAGACNGIVVRGCSPMVRNCIIEYNNVGVNCLKEGNARLYNCIIARSSSCGVRVQGANPVVYNSIIFANQNNGVWCDGVSAMTFEYNCLWGNIDGNFMECDPEMGVIKPMEKKGKRTADSVDARHNLCRDPMFAGTVADSLAAEQDVSTPTPANRVTDTAIVKALYDSIPKQQRPPERFRKYELSKYSPCIDAGNPDKQFKDRDGTRSDIGIWGGPDVMGSSK